MNLIYAAEIRQNENITNSFFFQKGPRPKMLVLAFELSLMWRSAATSKNCENNGTACNSLVSLHVESAHHLGFFRFELATNHMELLLFSLCFCVRTF